MSECNTSNGVNTNCSPLTNFQTQSNENDEDTDGFQKVDNYGLELAKISALSPSIVQKATSKIVQMNQGDLPRLSDEVVQARNYNLLYNRLASVAANASGSQEQMKQIMIPYCRELQMLCTNNDINIIENKERVR